MTLTRHGAATAPDGQSCTGPLASHIEGFAAQLWRKGYAQTTVRAKCDVLADLSRWLERRRLSMAALDEGRLRQFQAARRRRAKARRGDPATGQQLLEYLRDRGDVATAAPRSCTNGGKARAPWVRSVPAPSNWPSGCRSHRKVGSLSSAGVPMPSPPRCYGRAA